MNEHPEPCPTPASPFKVGAEVVVIEGQFAGLQGRVLVLNECGIEPHGRHVAICECQVELDRHSGRPMWFRYDTELAGAESGTVRGDDEASRTLSAAERAPGPQERLGGSGAIWRDG